MKRAIGLASAVFLVTLLRGSSAYAKQAIERGPDSPEAQHAAKDVKPPVLLKEVAPEYSDEARKAQLSGTVQVYLWVDRKGNPSHIKVVKSVGMGLDEKAVEAVGQYKFTPATRDGKPVTVDLYVDVNFEIVHKRVVLQQPDPQ